MTGALPTESQLLVYCCGYIYTFRLSEAWQDHYLPSHNFWCTVGFSGYTYTFRLSEARQKHYLLSHNFWCTVGFSGYTYTFRLPCMTGVLPAESQLLVYYCGYTYTFMLSEAWHEHYLLSHNFCYTIVAIPIDSGCQAWQDHYLLTHNFWYTVGLSAELQLLQYCCGYSYTFRLWEAWQEHYLLGYNFWYTVVPIPIHSGCQAWQEHYLLSHNLCYTVVAIPIHSDCQRHDRSITGWVSTSAILLCLFLYIQAVRGMTWALPAKSQLLVYCYHQLLCLYLYIQAVRGMTGALPAESQCLVYWWFLWLYLDSLAVRGMTEALPTESQLLVYCWFLWLYLYIQSVRHDRNITCWVTTSGVLLVLSGYTFTFRLPCMTGTLPAKS